jgi:hypothetical protein
MSEDKSKSLTIDRLEGDIAVCDGNINIAVGDLPEGVAEGDILVYNEEVGSYYIDKEATESRKKLMADKLNSLFNKHKGQSEGIV